MKGRIREDGGRGWEERKSCLYLDHDDYGVLLTLTST